MNTPEKHGAAKGAASELKPMLDALDGLYGVCENLVQICQEAVDGKDSRLLYAAEALTKAQDAIIKINEVI